MTEQDQAHVKDVLTFFYTSNPPTTIDDSLAELAARMLHAALEKSRALDLVPRPPGKPSAVWLLLEGVKTFWRSQGSRRILETAKRAVALQYRTEYELALTGSQT